MRHLLFLFIHDLILIQGKIKSTRYGLLSELALLVEKKKKYTILVLIGDMGTI